MSTPVHSLATLFFELYPYYGQCNPEQATLDVTAAKLAKATDPIERANLLQIIQSNH